MANTDGGEPMPPEVPEEDRPERFVRPEGAAREADDAGEVATESDPRFDEDAAAESATLPDPDDR